MALDSSTDPTPTVTANGQGAAVRRPFAPPSRAGLLVCAASLMPAYLFALMGLMNVLGLIAMLQADPSGDPKGPAAGWLHFGHQALSSSFSVLICWLFLIRRPSSQGRGAGGWVADAAAVGGTAIVLGLSMAPRTVEALWLLATAEAFITVGLVVMVIGLVSLGRSFGIMPRARGLKQNGLYRWVRHPIYLGALLALLGAALAAASISALLAAAVLFAALHGHVVPREEARLRRQYGGWYSDYAAETPRWF